MKILIIGGSGLIGTYLSRELLDDGHRVFILTRDPKNTPLVEGAQAWGWDGQTLTGWGERVREIDALVNLAGSTISSWPWTKARMQSILESRVNVGLLVTRALETASPRPGVLIQASGVGYYGPRGTELVTEETGPGNDFLADVAQQWESSTRLVDAMGVRRVVIRTGVVLSDKGGALPPMALPVRLFAGGPFGNGRQGFPWIHIADEVGAIKFLIENEKARGAYNLAAPNPVSNAAFIRNLADILHRPYWLPAPAFALKLALGGMSTLLLDGQFAVPRRLVDLGYSFQFDCSEDALLNLFG